MSFQNTENQRRSRQAGHTIGRSRQAGYAIGRGLGLCLRLSLLLSAGLVLAACQTGQEAAETAEAAVETEEEIREETAPAETSAAYETIPCGFYMYVNVEAFGEQEPYYDEEGNQIGALEHRTIVEVLSMEEELAPFYINDDYDVGYVASACLTEEDPGRQIRPIVAPTLTVEEAGAISIHVIKSERVLELLSDGEVIAVYSIGLGGWPYDPKDVKGDSRTPEGTYYICLRNANSRFHLALGISYPNKEDAARGYANGVITKKQKNAIDAAIDAGQQPPWNTGLGGEIEIHGASEDGIGSAWDWTAGCIAVEDAVIDILWEYCPMGTEVVIDP